MKSRLTLSKPAARAAWNAARASSGRVAAAERGEGRVVEALDADAQPVDAGRAEARQSLDGALTGVGLDGDLAVGAYVE
jgi:hypothetical protein